MNCPQCAQPNDPGAGRCNGCGRGLPPSCAGCGVPVPEGHDLCDRCRTERTPAEHADPAEAIEREAGPAPVELRAGFVGRREEMDRLLRVFARACEEEELRFVTITGEAGVGKSRLCEELPIEVAAAFADARTFRGAAVGLGAPPYLAIERMLEARFGIHEGEAPSTAREKILAGVGEAVSGPKATEIAHMLGHVMRRPFPDSPYAAAQGDSPTQLEMRMYMALRRFFDAESRNHPLVLIFDEMDRAPTETIKILLYLADGLASRPILVVALGRPEMLAAHPSWARGDYEHQHVTLSPLGDDDAEALAGDLVWRAPLPAALREHVRDKLHGNPRAIEETFRYLVEVEAARPTGAGPFVFDDVALSALPLPTTIDEILWARLRALPPAERDLLEKAAAVGELFWLDAVVALVRADALEGGDPDGPTIAELGAAGDRSRVAVAEGLSRLRARGFVRERTISQIVGEREYRFLGPAHALAYELAPEADRRRYHRVLAQWHELRPGRGEEAQEEVARHFERAGDTRIAAQRYRRAAEAARARYFNEEAIRLYREALRCAGTDGALRVQAWHDLGSVHEMVGDYERALDAFERVLRLSWVYASRAKGGVALNKVGRIWRRKGDLAMALEYFDKGLELFRQNDDERGVATSLDDIGWVLWLQGRYDEAFDRASRALEIRRAIGDRRSIAQSLTNLANIQKDRGLLDEAERGHREALEARRAIGDRNGVALSLNYLGLLEQQKGALDGAHAMLEEALREAEAIGAAPLMAMLLGNLGDLAVERGRLPEARQRLEQALAIGRELASRRVLSAAQRSLGIVELRLGNLSRARESCETALRIAERGAIRELVGRALVSLGEVEAATLFDAAGKDHRDAAREHFERAIALFGEMGNDAERARAMRRLGQLEVERGAEAQGKERLAQAQAIFQRLGVGVDPEWRELIKEISLTTAG